MGIRSRKANLNFIFQQLLIMIFGFVLIILQLCWKPNIENSGNIQKSRFFEIFPPLSVCRNGKWNLQEDEGTLPREPPSREKWQPRQDSNPRPTAFPSKNAFHRLFFCFQVPKSRNCDPFVPHLCPRKEPAIPIKYLLWLDFDRGFPNFFSTFSS